MPSNTYMKRKKGFSLVEIVVIAGIISVVTSILTVSYKNFLNNQRLNAAVEGTVSMIQKARERTLSSRDESGGSGKQYGVRFNISPTNTVQLISGGSVVTDSGTAGPIEETTFQMADGITLQSVTITPDPGGNKDIIFKRVSGDVTNSAGTAITTNVLIVLQSSSGSRTIQVGPAGIVEVQ